MLGLHHSTACKAEELTATIQPGLHHTAMKWLFLAHIHRHRHAHTRTHTDTHAHTDTHRHTDTHTQTRTHTHTLVLVAHCQNWSHGSPRERGERLKRNLGKMTQLAIEPPNGRHPLKSPKLWVDLKMIPLMGSPHLSKWVKTRCRKKIDGIRVSVPGSYCSYPCPQ